MPFFLQTLLQHFGKETKAERLDKKKILDIGCGGGLVTEEIAKQTKAKVIGMYTFGSIRLMRLLVR